MMSKREEELTKENEKLKQENERLNKLVEDYRIANDEITDENVKLTDENVKLKKQTDDLQQETKQYDEALVGVTRECSSLKKQNKNYFDELCKLSEKYKLECEKNKIAQQEKEQLNDNLCSAVIDLHKTREKYEKLFNTVNSKKQETKEAATQTEPINNQQAETHNKHKFVDLDFNS